MTLHLVTMWLLKTTDVIPLDRWPPRCLGTHFRQLRPVYAHLPASTLVPEGPSQEVPSITRTLLPALPQPHTQTCSFPTRVPNRQQRGTARWKRGWPQTWKPSCSCPLLESPLALTLASSHTFCLKTCKNLRVTLLNSIIIFCFVIVHHSRLGGWFFLFVLDVGMRRWQ